VKLADAQARFHALVTARDSVATIAARDAGARAAVDAMIAGDARLSAIDRLDVYASMYFIRVHDVLRDELPRTAALLGGEAFHGLVTDYLVACPPHPPSLREAGARLPDFLAAHALAAERPWLAEVARLERSRTEVFDGPDATPIAIAALRDVPPERFGALRFALIPSHRLLANRFAIAPIWRAQKAGEEAGEEAEQEAAEEGDDAAPPRAAPETLIVWRRDDVVYHRAADEDEARWLPRLARTGGVLFAELCAAISETQSDEAAAARAFELCARWTGEGLIVSV
jgi:hypothetical protein